MCSGGISRGGGVSIELVAFTILHELQRVHETHQLNWYTPDTGKHSWEPCSSSCSPSSLERIVSLVHMTTLLIKNAYIVTMDDRQRELPDGGLFIPTTTFLQTCFVEPRVVGTSKTTCACRLRPQSRDFAHANLVNPLKCRCRGNPLTFP